MSWPFTRRAWDATSFLTEARNTRGGSGISTRATTKDALRQSVIWAGLHLRADLVSMMPVDCFRTLTVDGQKVQVEVAKPPVLVTPGGDEVANPEWTYSTSIDLDSLGNTFGVISERDKYNLPSRIDLQVAETTTVARKKGELKFKFGNLGNEWYDAGDVWHEKQYTMSGVPVGLSPISYAARMINLNKSASEFAAEWFGNGASNPGGILRHTKLGDIGDIADAVKEKFKQSVGPGDIFVTGKDWEYQVGEARQSEAQFLETFDHTAGDLCRFIGVPGDMIDVATSGSSITYANITQRNLQLLITKLQPAIDRREKTWSRRLLPQPRYVKLNTNALLRMDLLTRYQAYTIAVGGKPWMVASEVRNTEDMPPLTDEQLAEMGAVATAAGPNGVIISNTPTGGNE